MTANISRGRAARLAILGATLSSALTACAPFARLQSTVVRDRFDSEVTVADLRIVRGGSVVTPTLSMQLQKGDSISTSSATRAVVQFAVGYTATLDTGTSIFIQNPSVLVKWGQVFLRRLLNRPDTLRTNTPQATMFGIGTGYLVTVTARATTLRVSEGAVRATSRDGLADWVQYRASGGSFEGGEFVNGARPRRMPAVNEAGLERELSWVRQVERVTMVPVPSLEGMTEAQAITALRELSLSVGSVTRESTGRARVGTVAQQRQEAGARVARGSAVSFTVEAPPGNARTGTATPTPCTVPPLVGKNAATAIAFLERAKLKGAITRQDRGVELVSSQAEIAGSRVACGVEIHYAFERK